MKQLTTRSRSEVIDLKDKKLQQLNPAFAKRHEAKVEIEKKTQITL